MMSRMPVRSAGFLARRGRPAAAGQRRTAHIRRRTDHIGHRRSLRGIAQVPCRGSVERLAGEGQAGGDLCGTGDAEVTDLQPAVGKQEEDGRLEIAVYHLLGMRGVERNCGLRRDSEGL